MKKTKHPNAKLINGNSEIGIETKFKNAKYRVLIHSIDVPELLVCKESDDGLEIGVNTTLMKFEKILSELCKSRMDFQIRGLEAILSNLKWFAGHQIRNV